MKKQRHRLTIPAVAAAGFGLLAAPALGQGPIEFSEFVPIIEINATDGDAGFHVLLDGDAWRTAAIWDPYNRRLLRAVATNMLRTQGATEIFMESAEPPCWFDPEDEEADPDEVVTVEEFLFRFKPGTYHARGRTNEDNEKMVGEGELTHELPAAPIAGITMEEDEDGEVELTLHWETGVDLGVCAVPDGITPPGEVEVVRWEVVVEPNEDELPGGELPEGVPFSKFTIQLPAGVHEIEVPEEFIQAYLDVGVNQFKGEVGAREESGNQTFTEFEFEVELAD